MKRPHPRHPDGPCADYDPDSLPGKGPKEIAAEQRTGFWTERKRRPGEDAAGYLPGEGEWWRGCTDR